MPLLKKLRLTRPSVNLRLQTGQTGELLTITMTLQTGLRTTLEHLAAQHGFKDGAWLDDIEKTLLSDASNISSSGLPIEAEARALNSGKAHIQALVTALRLQLQSIGKSGD